jgi:hypothetical protein
MNILVMEKQEEIRAREIFVGRVVLPEGDGRPPDRYLPVTLHRVRIAMVNWKAASGDVRTKAAPDSEGMRSESSRQVASNRQEEAAKQ